MRTSLDRTLDYIVCILFPRPFSFLSIQFYTIFFWYCVCLRCVCVCVCNDTGTICSDRKFFFEPKHQTHNEYTKWYKEVWYQTRNEQQTRFYMSNQKGNVAVAHAHTHTLRTKMCIEKMAELSKWETDGKREPTKINKFPTIYTNLQILRINTILLFFFFLVLLNQFFHSLSIVSRPVPFLSNKILLFFFPSSTHFIIFFFFNFHSIRSVCTYFILEAQFNASHLDFVILWYVFFFHSLHSFFFDSILFKIGYCCWFLFRRWVHVCVEFLISTRKKEKLNKICILSDEIVA